MAAARETAPGGFRGRRPRLRNRPGEGRGLPCVFGLAAQAGGRGGAGRHCSLRSLGACAGGGGRRRPRAASLRSPRAGEGMWRSWAPSLRSARAGLAKNERLVTLPLRKRGVRITHRPGRERGYPSYGETASAFPKKQRHQPFVFGHDASQMRVGDARRVDFPAWERARWWAWYDARPFGYSWKMQRVCCNCG